MAENVLCALCDAPTGIDDSREHFRIRPNVLAFHHEQFSMWRCNNCDSLHTKEQVDLEHYYRGYHMHDAPVGLYQRTTFRNRLRQLRRFGWRSGQSILDYGCGSGSFVRFLEQAGVPAVGYDPFSPDWSNPEHIARQFDLCVNYDVIEHVEDPLETLRQWRDLVRPGGLILVGTPNAANISLSDSWLPEIHVPYHRHIFSEQALRRMGESLGLRVRAVEHRYLQDSLIPGVNSRFVWNYCRWACDGIVDHLWGPPRIGAVAKSPRLWFDYLFGSFFPFRCSMTICFVKPAP